MSGRGLSFDLADGTRTNALEVGILHEASTEESRPGLVVEQFVIATALAAAISTIAAADEHSIELNRVVVEQVVIATALAATISPKVKARLVVRTFQSNRLQVAFFVDNVVRLLEVLGDLVEGTERELRHVHVLTLDLEGDVLSDKSIITTALGTAISTKVEATGLADRLEVVDGTGNRLAKVSFLGHHGVEHGFPGLGLGLSDNLVIPATFATAISTKVEGAGRSKVGNGMRALLMKGERV